MFNLIKMDMYRLFHSVSAWSIFFITVLAAVFSIVMTNMDMQISQENGNDVVFEDSSSEIVFGLYVTGTEEWTNGNIELGDLISTEVQSGLTALLCVIFAALFSNADQKNGYIKNIAGKFPRRGKLILSKFTAIAVWIFLVIFVFVVVTVVTGLIFWGDQVYVEAWMPLLKVLGVQYLLHLGIAVLTMFFCILTQSTAFSITAGIVLCTGLTAYLYAGINRIVSYINSGWKFDINSYVVENNIKIIGVDTMSDGMLRGAVIGIVYVILSVAFAVLTIKKRDIR